MKKQTDTSKIRKQWQPLTARNLSDSDCEKIADDIGLFFSALQRMKAELDEIQKRKIEEEARGSEQVIE